MKVTLQPGKTLPLLDAGKSIPFKSIPAYPSPLHTDGDDGYLPYKSWELKTGSCLPSLMG